MDPANVIDWSREAPRQRLQQQVLGLVKFALFLEHHGQIVHRSECFVVALPQHALFGLEDVGEDFFRLGLLLLTAERQAKPVQQRQPVGIVLSPYFRTDLQDLTEKRFGLGELPFLHEGHGNMHSCLERMRVNLAE